MFMDVRILTEALGCIGSRMEPPESRTMIHGDVQNGREVGLVIR